MTARNIVANFAAVYLKITKTTQFMKAKQTILLSAMSLACCLNMQAQKVQRTDTVKVKTGENNERNVMLNAQNNVGPREINVGLPASVGGTNIFQNGMPVSYHFWP